MVYTAQSVVVYTRLPPIPGVPGKPGVYRGPPGIPSRIKLFVAPDRPLEQQQRQNTKQIRLQKRQNTKTMQQTNTKSKGSGLEPLVVYWFCLGFALVLYCALFVGATNILTLGPSCVFLGGVDDDGFQTSSGVPGAVSGSSPQWAQLKSTN